MINEIIQEKIARARVAQTIAADYSQAQVDSMVRAIGKRAYDEGEVCAKIAFEETMKGCYESKLTKHKKTCLMSWLVLKNAKSVGVVEENKDLELQKVAKPVGVIACITPVTNPTSTPCGNAMHILKGRNACIICPHPGATKSTTYAVNIMRDELRKLGYPEDLIQIIEEPTLDMSKDLMSACDVVVATGGPGMVKAAYSSGRPSLGVGQGNVQSILDVDFPDLDLFVEQTVINRTYDFGMPCTTEQTLHIPVELIDTIIEKLKAKKAFYIDDPEKIQLLREVCFPEGMINRYIVGQPPSVLASLVGIKIPEDTSLLVCRVEKWGTDEPLAREIMTPFLRILPYSNFEDAVERARTNYLMEGAGHSGAIWSNNDKKIALAGERIPVGRLVVNQNATAGGGGPQNNGLKHTISLGCGYWGGNSIGENLNYSHLMNYTYISKIIEGKSELSPEEIWAE